MPEIPPAIGDVYSDATTPGGSGNVTGKLRLMTEQLATLNSLTAATSGGGSGGGGGTVVVSGITTVVVSGHIVSQATSEWNPVTAATGITVVPAPGIGNHLRILYFQCSNSSGTVVTAWSEGLAGVKRYPAYLPQGGIFSRKLSPDIWRVASNTAFCLHTNSGCSVYFTVEYLIYPD